MRLHLNITDRFFGVLRLRNFVEELNASVKVTRDPSLRLMQFTIAGIFPAKLDCDIFWTPFEELQTRITASVTAHDIKFLGKRTHVYFNILQSEEETALDRVFNVEHVSHFTEYTLDKSSREFSIICHRPSDQDDVELPILTALKQFFGIATESSH